MGLEASLKLLDLPADATIDDANQAYAYLQRMVDLFHQDNGNRGDRQADMELLTCAYEKTVAHLSDPDPEIASPTPIETPLTSMVDQPESTDLHFTINFSAEADTDALPDDVTALPQPNAKTVEEAIAITSRQVQQSESTLPKAQAAVESAKQVVSAAKQRHEAAKQASLTAFVAVKSAKARALLLELETKRAVEEAAALAERSRKRVLAVKQVAEAARAQAGKARQQAMQIKKSVETAAAEAVCAEDRLEKRAARLKTMTLTLIEARNRMKMFRDTSSAVEKEALKTVAHCSPAIHDDPVGDSRAVSGSDADDSRQMMSDLLDIEASLKAVGRGSIPDPRDERDTPEGERRRHPRLVYPPDRRPQLIIDGRPIPILDLSTVGMRLDQVDDLIGEARIVRGAVAFEDRSPVKVAGRVVRQDGQSVGLRLVTRIGNHILDTERSRLVA